MPPLTRWTVKASLVYLVAGLLVGAAVAGGRTLGLPAWVSRLQPVYIHLLVVGWLTQLIMGVAYWMFPVYRKGRPYFSERLGWICFGLLNAGLLGRVGAESVPAITGGARMGWPFALAAGLQWLGGLAFVINTWPRVKRR